MTDIPLPKRYNFKNTEEKIYKFWENSGYFDPSNQPENEGFNPNIKPYVIAIPPPNVTGELHLGHAMFVAMEDLMIRYHRMKGIPTLWIPGSDHAGIATQLQVEKALAKENKKREDIGREAFIEMTWDWKRKFGGIITQQIRRLGASCDWNRERFTLDEGLSKAVREAFVRLYEKGLIYRGPRLINWSPGLKTAVSDLEVEYHEEKGIMYYFKYMLANKSGDFLPVATTRPETILGDSGVAVHPNDDRYKGFIGENVIVPILGREIPVIADEYVDRDFGTGALKVTPGHDPNDYDIGNRHNLEIISVLDLEARINEYGGPYKGLDRFECREKMWKDMQKANLVIKEEAYVHQVPRSQRGGEIIEPMISTQWFVDIKPLAQKALDVVKEGKIQIIPQYFTKTYYNWLENIQDWCISRQLWWGHRIPVWYCENCDGITVARIDPSTCEHCKGTNIYQDPDVLDTWFSSGLWPFSTLGWPEMTPDYHYFYPNTMMETGYDILFFWVARMIMMGLEFTGEIPFSTVYLHGLIRDGNGKKMSKTAGNVIDPLIVMDEMGTDALRFTLLVGSTPGKDMNISLKKVEANRNFANKVWNAGRFIINSIPKAPNSPNSDPGWTPADSWIWARLQELIRQTERLFSSHQYGEAGRQIYEFIWSEFADWYLEIAKLQISEGEDRAFYTVYTITQVFDLCLRLLHPFTPFVTEELWGHLKSTAENHSNLLSPKGGWPEALIIAPWPTPRDEESWELIKTHEFNIIQEVVKAIRNLRAETQIKPGELIPAILVTKKSYDLIRRSAKVIGSLSHLDQKKVKIIAELDNKPEDHIGLVAGHVEIFIPLSGLINFEEERNRLLQSLTEANEQVQRLENLLAGPFSQKAPQEVVNKEKSRLMTYKEKIRKIKSQLEN